MKIKKPKHYAWPTNKEQAAHMKMRQKQNLLIAKTNKAENWMKEQLEKTSYKWTRQSIWGIRLFDFWCHKLGVAIEVDGAEHNKKRDWGKDMIDFQVSGIIVLRVKNFNQVDADQALEKIKHMETWNERRIKLGLKIITT